MEQEKKMGAAETMTARINKILDSARALYNAASMNEDSDFLLAVQAQPKTNWQPDSPNTNMTRESFDERVKIELLARQMGYDTKASQ